MSELTVWSINLGRCVSKTPDEEPQTLKWLKSLSEPGAVVPDVLCLQDFRISMLQYLRNLPHFHFAPMTNHRIWGKRELVGICIASRYVLRDINVCYTWGDGVIRDLQGVGETNHRIGNTAEDDRIVNESESRVAIAATVMNGGAGMRLGTTHGFWVRGGVPTPEQRESTENLAAYFAGEGMAYGTITVAADWNFDKEGMAMGILKGSGAKDWLPDSIETTLPSHHPGAKFKAKPDNVLTWQTELAAVVRDVHLDPAPGSDHLMLCCNVKRVVDE